MIRLKYYVFKCGMGVTTKEVGKGTELGLAIGRQIVEEKHGGFIQVNSIMGQRTKFIISLPN